MRKIIFIIIIITLAFSSGCSNKKKEVKEINVAEQFGLAYAPIQIMKEKEFLQEELVDYKINWVKLGNASAIRESIIANKLDIGFMGIPPFIIGKDNDTNWKIFTGLSKAPLGLVTDNKDIKTLNDIRNKDKIVVPQPGSIQHILLKMALDKEFNQADKFDNQLITMNHSDGKNALLSSDEVNLHFTSPPYLFKELEDDKTHLVIDSNEAFGGEFTFIVGVCDENFYNRKEEFNLFNKALDKSIDFINNNHEETIEILLNYYDYDKETLENYLYNKEIFYNDEIKGLDHFIKFMYKTKMIEKNYNESDLIWKDEEKVE